MNARRGIRPLLLKFACLLFVSACSLGDLAGGQLTLINDQVRLERAIELERDPERRALLMEVPKICSFAEQVVGLWAGKSYTGYYATERKGLTFVVTASERLRLAPYSWWFPIAGKVEYRSYWDEDDANAQAAELEAAGYDTWISASRAYSTLGIFRDPVITTMLRDGLPALVEVLVHELSHAKLYVPGHTDWNEALASFVGERGAERYFEAPQFAATPYPAEVRARAERRERFDSLISATGTQLEELYASAQPAALKLRERERVFLQLSAALQELSPKDDPETWRMNNARIVHYRRYSASGALLAEMWRRSDQNFRRFWLLAEAHSKTLQ
ncbi:MAG TPA: aminopeptidase [Polyangiales bacterium]|nr:aminopeptidase [Polyangiales bacterium]